MMKYFLISGCVFMLCLGQCKKTVIPADQGNLAAFQLLGGDQMDEAVEMVTGDDGSIWILGNSSSFGRGDQDMYLARLNENGILQWQRFLGGRSNDVSAGLEIEQNTVAIAGTYVRPDSNGMQVTTSSDIFFSKVDAQGNIITEKMYRFNSSSKDLGQTIGKLSNNNYVMGGSINGVGGILLYTQNNGDTLWSRYLPQPALRVNGLMDVTQTANGQVACIGYQGMDSLVFFVFDLLGQRLQTVYLSVPNARNSRAKLLADSDGSVILAFSRQISPLFADILIRKYNNAFQLLWSKSLTNGGLSVFRQIRKTTTGDLLIAGSQIPNGESLPQAYFSRINASGELIWEKFFKGSIYAEGVDVAAYKNEKTVVLINNARVNQSNTDILIGHLDKNGDWDQNEY